MKMATILILMLVVTQGCLSSKPCMSGFDLGMTYGVAVPSSQYMDNYSYGEVSSTIYFDTTGLCNHGRRGIE